MMCFTKVKKLAKKKARSTNIWIWQSLSVVDMIRRIAKRRDRLCLLCTIIMKILLVVYRLIWTELCRTLPNLSYLPFMRTFLYWAFRKLSSFIVWLQDCCWAQPDIQVAVVYVYTRVQEPIEDNYLKLAGVIQNLRATMHLPFVIGWDDTRKPLWSINASFVVHNDMYSHMGTMLIFGKRAVCSLWNEQKVNSVSSTVDEIIRMDDTMNFLMWVQLFIQQQVEN